VPPSWLHVLFWAGLRGAVSVSLALSIPVGLPNRDLIQGTVFGIVLFTLIVQGSTARQVIERSGAGQVIDRDPDAPVESPVA
jgi:CPA1 family monovalent cation:H+ antiporter